jgi:hypothetical protein
MYDMLDGLDILAYSTTINLIPETLYILKVYCYELQSNGAGGLSNIIKQSQIAHEAPVLCTDIGSVRPYS